MRREGLSSSVAMRRVFGMLLQEELAQIGEREAGVEDVLDDQHVLALDGMVEVLDELDRAGGALALAVAGGGDKVEGGVDLDGSRQVGQKECRALEHADHDQLFAVQVTGDLRAHLGDALGDLLAGIKNFKALVGHGSHAHSIARIEGKRVCANQACFQASAASGAGQFEECGPLRLRKKLFQRRYASAMQLITNSSPGPNVPKGAASS